MTVHAIVYDLHEPGQEYQELYDAIKSFGDYCHILESCWLVDTEDDASEIRDKLKPHIDSNDRLMVMRKSDTYPSWSTTFSSDCTEWLHDH